MKEKDEQSLERVGESEEVLERDGGGVDGHEAEHPGQTKQREEHGGAFKPGSVNERVHAHDNKCISSVESQKGAITIQRCSVENQKGVVATDIVQR